MKTKTSKPESKEKVTIGKQISTVTKLIRGELSIPEKAYGKFRKKLIRAARITFASIEKFMTDDCLTKASSIAYTTIISLIPMLAVGLTFFSWGGENFKEQLFTLIQQKLEAYNLSRLNIDPFLDAISNLIDNARSIGGIGAVVLVFSATAVLRTLEHSFNTIWNVKRERPWVLKMIYYWAAITLGPLMLIAGTTAAAQISTIFNAPNLKAITQTDDGTLWLGGNKGVLRYALPGTKTFVDVGIDRIDFDNQIIYRYDPTTRLFSKDEANLDSATIQKAEFRDIQFVGGTGWAVGRDGLILKTTDGGQRWRIEKWGSFNFKTIALRDGKISFIGADGGYFFRSRDDGMNWEVLSWSEVTGDINQIAFFGKTGIAVCNRGYILKTVDGGVNWQPKLLEKGQSKKQRYENLNSIDFYDEGTAWIAGNNGLIMMTNDAFATFNVKHFKRTNYTAALVRGSREGYVAGENGTLIYTKDGGGTWQFKSIHTGDINKLVLVNQDMWAIGSSGLLISGTAISSSWKGEKGTSIYHYLLNFFLPFIFIWLFFLLTYQFLPNTKIPFRPAAIGASISGAIWVGFILGFIVYVKSFANGTFAVYGALAAFPIFLLLVYASAVIILYGSEVSYMIVNLESYMKQKRIARAGNDLSVYNGIRILYAIHKKFEKSGGATEPAEISKLCERSQEADYFLNLFKKEKLLIETDGGGLVPAQSSDMVSIKRLLEIIHDANLSIPSNAPDDALRKSLTDIFNELSLSRDSIIGEMKLSEIIKV